jgi:hypothetical protein
MNVYTRELIERESILLQSRRDGLLDDEPPVRSANPSPVVTHDVVMTETAPETNPSPWVSLWRLLQTPVPDLLFPRPSRRQFA